MHNGGALPPVEEQNEGVYEAPPMTYDNPYENPGVPTEEGAMPNNFTTEEGMEGRW